MKLKDKPQRINELFVKELDSIRRLRYGKGQDKKPLSINRLTRRIVLSKDWFRIKQDLLLAPNDPTLEPKRKRRKKYV